MERSRRVLRERGNISRRHFDAGTGSQNAPVRMLFGLDPLPHLETSPLLKAQGEIVRLSVPQNRIDGAVERAHAVVAWRARAVQPVDIAIRTGDVAVSAGCDVSGAGDSSRSTPPTVRGLLQQTAALKGRRRKVGWNSKIHFPYGLIPTLGGV